MSYITLYSLVSIFVFGICGSHVILSVSGVEQYLMLNGTQFAFTDCASMRTFGLLCWNLNTTYIEIAFQSDVPGPNGWLGFGFSHGGDLPMISGTGSEAVVGWPYTASSGPFIHNFQLVGQFTGANQPNSIGLSLISKQVSIDNGTTTIHFIRPLNLPSNPWANIDLVNGVNVIYAHGSAPTSHTLLAYHGGGNRDYCNINFATGTIVNGGEELYHWKQKHAALMTISFGLFIPLGILFARYFKSFGPGWFLLHRICVISGLCIALGGWIIALTQLYSSNHPTHRGIGLYVMSAALMQPLNAVIRPHPPSNGDKATIIRQIWAFLHINNGRAAFVLAIVNCYIGFGIDTFQISGGTVEPIYEILFSIMWGTIVFVGVILEIRRWITGKEFGSDKMALKLNPAAKVATIKIESRVTSGKVIQKSTKPVPVSITSSKAIAPVSR